jgi:Flp pilus assembly pilin Flp
MFTLAALRPTMPQEAFMFNLLRASWSDDSGQDVAEYAVMLAIILVIVVGTIRLVGSKSNNIFSQAASALG